MESTEITTSNNNIELRTQKNKLNGDEERNDGASPAADEIDPVPRADIVPKGSKILSIVASLQRVVFYGITTPFQNYLQNPPDDKYLPGALGLGQAKAVAIVSAFGMLVAVIPILGGILADSYLGRYRTYLYGTIVYAVGCVLVFATSFKACIRAAPVGFGIGATMLALGIGIAKSSEVAYVADQYNTVESVPYQKNGLWYIADRDMTVQAIYAYYYVAINLAGLAMIVTPFLERYVGYWVAYLVSIAPFTIIIPVLILSKKTLVHPATHPTSLLLGICKLQYKKLAALFSKQDFSAEEEEMSRHIKPTLVACRIFLAYPIFWLCFNQINSNLVSQAGQMNTHGIPNDMIQLVNPIACIILIPLCDKYIYPFLAKKKMSPRLITKILLGFLFAAISVAYSAGIQKAIYNNRPCLAYHDPCQDADLKHAISVFVQVPVYVLLTIAEVFAVLAGSQLAYKSAPINMKSLVQCLYLLTSAVGSALNIALVKLSQDPYLVTFYSTLSAITFAVTTLLWLVFRNHKEE